MTCVGFVRATTTFTSGLRRSGTALELAALSILSSPHYFGQYSSIPPPSSTPSDESKDPWDLAVRVELGWREKCAWQGRTYWV